MCTDIMVAEKKAAYEAALTSTPDPNSLLVVNFGNRKESADILFAKCDINRETIRGWDDAAKNANCLVGRTILEGRGDGYAVYVIVKENKTTIRMRVCLGIGDDWVIPYWGEECSMPKKEALDRTKPSKFDFRSF